MSPRKAPGRDHLARRVEQVMSKEPRCCRSGDVLSEAARILWEDDCGVVPVIASDGSNRLIGIVTDRDLCMAAYTQGRRLAELPVSTAMSSDPVTCAPSNTLEDAAAAMRRAQVRRLPVVDEAGQVLGILSLADLAREAARRTGASARSEAFASVGETLGSIVQARAV